MIKTRTDKLDILCNLIAMAGCIVVMIGLIYNVYVAHTFIIGGTLIGLGLAMKFDVWKLHPKHALIDEVENGL